MSGERQAPDHVIFPITLPCLTHCTNPNPKSKSPKYKALCIWEIPLPPGCKPINPSINQDGGFRVQCSKKSFCQQNTMLMNGAAIQVKKKPVVRFQIYKTRTQSHFKSKNPRNPIKHDTDDHQTAKLTTLSLHANSVRKTLCLQTPLKTLGCKKMTLVEI